MPVVHPDIQVFTVAGFQGEADLFGCRHVLKRKHAAFDQFIQVLNHKV